MDFLRVHADRIEANTLALPGNGTMVSQKMSIDDGFFGCETGFDRVHDYGNEFYRKTRCTNRLGMWDGNNGNLLNWIWPKSGFVVLEMV